MKIHQIYTDNSLRNFTYIIELDNQSAYVIDPWDSEIVSTFLKERSLSLTAIINTHEHWDHTKGNLALVNSHHCEVWGHVNGKDKIPGMSRILRAHEKVQIEPNVILEVINTPGHCLAHLCFIVHDHGIATHIFTGDILFNAGVGNCHGGDVSDMYNTIQEKFESLPDGVIILPGHDYLENNLNFTISREPSNQMAKKWLSKYAQSDLYTSPLKTSMADEREMNTFFRLKNKEIIANLTDEVTNDKDVFISLRKLRDQW